MTNLYIIAETEIEIEDVTCTVMLTDHNLEVVKADCEKLNEGCNRPRYKVYKIQISEVEEQL